MKATKVTYSKMFNLGSYEHEEISIEIQIEEGEKAQEVLELAKKFVNSQHVQPDMMLEESYRIVSDPDNHTPRRVREAQAYIEENSMKHDDLPF